MIIGVDEASPRFEALSTAATISTRLPGNRKPLAIHNDNRSAACEVNLAAAPRITDASRGERPLEPDAALRPSRQCIHRGRRRPSSATPRRGVTVRQKAQLEAPRANCSILGTVCKPFVGLGRVGPHPASAPSKKIQKRMARRRAAASKNRPARMSFSRG